MDKIINHELFYPEILRASAWVAFLIYLVLNRKYFRVTTLTLNIFWVMIIASAMCVASFIHELYSEVCVKSLGWYFVHFFILTTFVWFIKFIKRIYILIGADKFSGDSLGYYFNKLLQLSNGEKK